MKASELIGKQEYIKSGFTVLDELLGGGISKGYITEFYGNWGVGKSTLALQIIASAQKAGHECMYSDTEYAFTVEYAESLGVDCKELEFTQLRFAEETFDAIEEWATSHKDALIVLDSMGGVLPKEEGEKSAEGKTIGLQSRLMAAFCRKMIGILAENKIALLIVNHEVTNISTGSIGSSGGAKLAFHKRYSVRMKSAYGKQSSRTTDGSKRNKYIEAELKKEKGMDTREGRTCELVIELGRGFVNPEDITQVKRGRPAKI